MTLEARIVVRQGRFTLDVELTADAGEVVAVLGPNGSGKTTLLRALAGLLPLDEGRITLDTLILDDSDDVFVPPEQRPVGVVFQDYLLFPNMSARENVAFGLRARGVPKADARRTADEWLERVGLAEKAAARPRQLSGGEAQRVALARALATHPRLLLLDEPMSALDAGTRVEIRRELRGRLAQFDGIRLLVTHDPTDAFALADRLVVLEDGRVVQAGPLAEVTARPRSPYVADLVGVNLYRGRSDGHSLFVDGRPALNISGAPAGDLFAAVPPRAVALYRDEPHGSPRNVWPARVVTIDPNGERVRVGLGGRLSIVAEITRSAADDLGVATGAEVWVSVKATEISLYPE